MRNLLKFELFRQFPFRWALVWLLIPNLAIMAMWPVGGPAMASTIFCSGLIALLVSQRDVPLTRALGILAIFVITSVVYVTKSFNIGVENVLLLPDYLGELSVVQSPEYIVATLLLFVSMGAALYFGVRTPTLVKRDQVLMALAGVALIVNVDGMATAGTRGSYKASAPAGAPIDSAVIQTGLSPDTVKARNLVIILVESWGVASDPLDEKINAEIWNKERWASRYAVTEGQSVYYGSTTNAEVRELCGAWADHLTFDFANSHCLPEAFAEKGFATHSLHAFNSGFFDRKTWYPQLGFQNIAFGDDLVSRGAHFCDGVFAGACDFDVAPEVGNILRTNRDKRNLVYWLTLNAHLPLDSNELLGTDPCRLGPAGWRDDYPMLCRSYQVHKVLADSITREIMRPDFPEADILIVGDHMPPFFPRAIRSRFDASRVPYFFLRARSALDVPAKPVSASGNT